MDDRHIVWRRLCVNMMAIIDLIRETPHSLHGGSNPGLRASTALDKHDSNKSPSTATCMTFTDACETSMVISQQLAWCTSSSYTACG
ncbi:hypothetical protein N9L68_05050, partial [bacterium]|nr:hypothetical protein [bacterium]